MCAGDDKETRKGQVLTLLAEQALQCLDFKTSYIHCQDLMAAGTLDAQTADFYAGFYGAYFDFPRCGVSTPNLPTMFSIEVRGRKKQRWCIDFVKMGLPEARD